MAQLVESCAIIVFYISIYFYSSSFLVFRIIVINFVMLKLENTITNT